MIGQERVGQLLLTQSTLNESVLTLIPSRLVLILCWFSVLEKKRHVEFAIQTQTNTVVLQALEHSEEERKQEVENEKGQKEAQKRHRNSENHEKRFLARGTM